MNKTLNSAGALIIVICLILTTSTVIGIKNEFFLNKDYNLYNVHGKEIGGPIVWDNLMDFEGFMPSQWDRNISYDFYHADDFQFDDS